MQVKRNLEAIDGLDMNTQTIERQNKSQLVWTPISAVERRSNLSYDEFIREYASVGKPVIITDAMKDWQALTKWNLNFFRSKYGTAKVRIIDCKDKTSFSMNLADYIDYMAARDRERLLYIDGWRIYPYPELFEDYKVPVYFPNWLERLPKKLLEKYYQLDNRELFIGSKDTSIGLHEDPVSQSAWLALISGRKRIFLFTPDQKHLLYDGKVDTFNPDLEKFPLYARTTPVEVILEPQEILYIPSNWWHHVKNLEDSIALGSLFINELNAERVFQAASAIDNCPINSDLLRWILKFPLLGRILFTIGLI
ncbi:cupin-like domain-containing protein [Chroococcidiopsis sp. SAG 2025]|uniref:cupin-like domain-containing protein n=1 Tax=Chroococcidiopsis sp. SAG 2025 TaxID=171389 RepID=UPI002936EC29|nr:cupin-like domain-containing protein [Chroococcidiopsis sp. SAG 2025]